MRYVPLMALACVVVGPCLDAASPRIVVLLDAAKAESFLQSLGYKCKPNEMSSRTTDCWKSEPQGYKIEFGRNDAGHVTLLTAAPPREGKLSRADALKTLEELSQLPYPGHDAPRVRSWLRKVSADPSLMNGLLLEVGRMCFSYAPMPEGPILMVSAASCSPS